MGQSWIFVIASLVAFAASQSWDVWIFHKVREKYILKHGSRKGGRWIWNNASTMTSQFIDSVLYVLIAFGIGFRWLFQKEMLGMLIAMIAGQYVVKFLIAILDTPLFYLLTRDTKKVEANEQL